MPKLKKLSGKYNDLSSAICRNKQTDELNVATTAELKDMIEKDIGRNGGLLDFDNNIFFNVEQSWLNIENPCYEQGVMDGSAITGKMWLYLKTHPDPSNPQHFDDYENKKWITLSFSYYNQKNELCGFSFCSKKNDTSLWFAADIQNIQVKDEERNVEIICNEEIFPFTNDILSQEVKRPDLEVVEIIKNSNIRKFLQNKLVENGVVNTDAITQLFRFKKSKKIWDKLFSITELLSVIAQSSADTKTKILLTDQLNTIKSEKEYKDFIAALTKNELPYIQELRKILPDHTYAVLRYVENEYNDTSSIPYKWINNQLTPEDIETNSKAVTQLVEAIEFYSMDNETLVPETNDLFSKKKNKTDAENIQYFKNLQHIAERLSRLEKLVDHELDIKTLLKKTEYLYLAAQVPKLVKKADIEKLLKNSQTTNLHYNNVLSISKKLFEDGKIEPRYYQPFYNFVYYLNTQNEPAALAEYAKLPQECDWVKLIGAAVLFIGFLAVIAAGVMLAVHTGGVATPLIYLGVKATLTTALAVDATIVIGIGAVGAVGAGFFGNSARNSTKDLDVPLDNLKYPSLKNSQN